MNDIFIALLVKKIKVQEGIYICRSIGPIVGLLMGTHFLSSHSKKYIPMFKKINTLEGNQFYKEIDFRKEPFFQSQEEYAYYELKKIDNYDTLEIEINEYKKNFKDTTYWIDLTTKTPVFIRYKKKAM